MSAPIPLRRDFDASQLRSLARRTNNGPQARRLLALAAIYDGATRTEAAKIGGIGLQIIRDWVLRFNARGPDALLNGKSPGQPCKLNDLQRRAIGGMIESGPIPAVHGVVRWRLIDLAQWVFEEFRITIAKQTSAGSCAPWATANSRPDRATMRKRKARLRILKKLSRAPGGNRARQGARLRHDRNLVRRRGSHRPEEQDHPSLGEARHPPQRAPRPAYCLHLHLGAVCPKEGKGAALILPACNTEAMNLHLAEIAAAVAPAAHAILLV